QALASPLTARRFFDAAPRINAPEVKIDGFPEFAVTVDTLPPDARAKITALAKKIVASHKTGSPIISFAVQGHADVALKEPLATRAQFEKEVSFDRAFNGDEALAEAISREPGGKDVLAKMTRVKPKGFGSQFREVVPARTEAEMRRNRRIEIFI